jgi:hypothetical protein
MYPAEEMFRLHWEGHKTYDAVAKWCKENGVKSTKGATPLKMTVLKTLWRWAYANHDTAKEIIKNSLVDVGEFWDDLKIEYVMLYNINLAFQKPKQKRMFEEFCKQHADKISAFSNSQ